MKLLKAGITIRGDNVYCPLCVSIDSYGNCLADCWHCVFRRLNHVWGKELKPCDTELLEKRLRNGLKNQNPKSPLSWALQQKKTLRLGNKTDPYQDIDKKLGVTRRILHLLQELDWSVVIQTRHTQLLMDRDTDIIQNMRATVMPIISPGLEKDWEVFERKRTTNPLIRISHCKQLIKMGIPVGVNGEPFIPGFHTAQDFQNVIQKIKAAGVKSYNTYNLHANDFVYKRIVGLPGVDIEKIWEGNKDPNWKPVFRDLIKIAKKEGIDLGCPDFVNAGGYSQKANTCCGIDVPNPCTFNAITWKKKILQRENPEEIFEKSWDHVSDFEKGKKVFYEKSSDFFTLYDAGFRSIIRKEEE